MGGDGVAAKEKKKESSGVPSLEVGERVRDVYEVRSKLGEGGYGAVYELACTVGARKDQHFAMKIESAKEPLQTLKMEVLVLQALETAGATHACRMLEGGQTDSMRFIIMTMLGPSLQTLRKERRSQSFGLGTALRCGAQTLDAIKEVHDVGFLHRDIKPGNFAIGRTDDLRRWVYVYDFGIARKFRDQDGGIRKPRRRAGFRGTLRYAPIACHLQTELCRKDDLETWVYMLVELTAGRLPWREMTTKDEVHKAKAASRKAEGLATLFHRCPPTYAALLETIDGTAFTATPAYDRMAEALTCEMATAALKPDAPFDWELNSPALRTRSASKDRFPLHRPRPRKSPSANH